MQRHRPLSTSTTSSSASQRSGLASASLRRNLRSQDNSGANVNDDDDVSDPRPWETRGPLNLYGSSKDHLHLQDFDRSGSPPVGDLPLYEMEPRRRNVGYGEKEDSLAAADGMEKKELLFSADDDDSGKWGKGYGAGPGYGGKRGLAPRSRRIPGWVSDPVLLLLRVLAAAKVVM